MRIAPLLFLVLWAGCGDREVPAAELGERRFADPSLSTSPFNVFACATCHAVIPAAPPVIPGRFDSGYNLADVAGRGSWWGGHASRLLDAINVCLDRFMGGRQLLPEEEEARQLYAYLEAESPTPSTDPLPLTIVRNVTGLPGVAGDADGGRDVYRRACQRCHGEARSGRGRIDPRASVVPDDTLRAFPDNARAIVEEKIRHGRFFNIGGVMPLYTLEALSDRQVADVLTYLGL